MFLQEVQFIALLSAASIFGVHFEALQGGLHFVVKGDLGFNDSALIKLWAMLHALAACFFIDALVACCLAAASFRTVI